MGQYNVNINNRSINKWTAPYKAFLRYYSNSSDTEWGPESCRINTQGKDVTQAQRQRLELPTVTLTSQLPYDVPLVEFTYLLFTGMPGESLRRWPSLCHCACVTSFEHWLTPLCIDSFEQCLKNAFTASVCHLSKPITHHKLQIKTQ